VRRKSGNASAPEDRRNMVLYDQLVMLEVTTCAAKNGLQRVRLCRHGVHLVRWKSCNTHAPENKKKKKWCCVIGS
jgi:hypothetical protein